MTEYFNRPEYKPHRRAARAALPRAETMLWSKLKGRQLLGCKFRRQYGVGAYRLDFYSPELMLAVELDGDSHQVSEAYAHDRRRDAYLSSLGIRILRIANDDVYGNLEGVWEAIARAAREQMTQLGPNEIRGRRPKRERK